MRKTIVLSLAAMAATSTLNAADDVASMFSEGKVDGQIRMFHIDREYSGGISDVHRNGTALGGKLRYETASLNGLSLGMGFYTTNRIFQGIEKDVVEPSLFDNEGKSYSILGEAYVDYDMKALGTASSVRLGRQRLDTPLAGSDDARMVPNMFTAYVLHNNDIENVTLALAHVTDFASGSFANIYSSGGILAATAGYSPLGNGTVGEFTNMGTYAVGEETDGVTAAAAIYGNDNVKLQAWDYYAHDILNAIYLQGDLKWKCRLSDSVKPFASAQLIKEDNVGDNLLQNLGGDGEIDSLYWAVKAGATVGNLTAYVAYSQTSANDDGDAAYANAIISPWGGMPAFTQGMVTRHMFLAGTNASKVAATYNFAPHGANVNATVYYASFDMDENNGYTSDKTATEPGFDIIYNPQAVKNLQLRLRGNFPSDFKEADGDSVDWSEYRLIANYNF